MTEGIVTPDGKPVPVELNAPEETEKAFARAMSEPAGADDKAPPKRAERKPAAPKSADKPRVTRGPGRPPKSDSAAKPGLSKELRVQGVAGIVQLAAGGCLLAERGTGQKAYKADAITLASSAADIGSAVADVADQDERFARVIDKVCAAGPYSALISVMFSVGSQIARNHGAAVPGTADPDDLIKAAEMPVAA